MHAITLLSGNELRDKQDSLEIDTDPISEVVQSDSTAYTTFRDLTSATAAMAAASLGVEGAKQKSASDQGSEPAKASKTLGFLSGMGGSQPDTPNRHLGAGGRRRSKDDHDLPKPVSHWHRFGRRLFGSLKAKKQRAAPTTPKTSPLAGASESNTGVVGIPEIAVDEQPQPPKY